MPGVPELEDSELGFLRYELQSLIGDLKGAPHEASVADMIQLVHVALESPPLENDASDRIVEPPEFTKLRAALRKAADAVEAARDEPVETIQKIPVPKPPLIAGHPMRNPFAWVLGGALDNAGDSMLQPAIDYFRREADASYLDAITEILETGGFPWEKKGEEAAS